MTKDIKLAVNNLDLYILSSPIEGMADKKPRLQIKTSTKF